MNDTAIHTEPSYLELADYLARAIFVTGYEPHDKTQRIAFKGGHYPDAETDLGGLCLSALRDRIDFALRERPRFIPDELKPTP